MRKYILMAAASMMCLFLMCGCSNDEVYTSLTEYRENATASMDELTSEVKSEADSIDLNEIKNEAKSAGTKVMATSTTAMGHGLNRACPPVIIGSLVIGVILLLIANKANAIKLKQTAIGLFMIAIPVIMLLITYGMAFMSSWFSTN